MSAHPTTYAGVNFRSRLEARWAAFFNCMQWKWQYEPYDLEGWTPDFVITFNKLVLLVEVKPYFQVDQFSEHPCMKIDCGNLASTTAGFGIEPSVTIFRKPILDCYKTLYSICPIHELEIAWLAAGNLTQWKKQRRKRARSTNR